jgi:lipoate-protein ligase A
MDSCRRDRVDIVRRMTGGGAIFHDREVTYSIVCSARDLGGGEHSVMQSFERLNGMFLDMYKEFGLTARFAGTSPEPGMPDRISQFCFSGREKYDILMDNRKIGGNAQRRTRPGSRNISVTGLMDRDSHACVKPWAGRSRMTRWWKNSQQHSRRC